MPGTGRVMFSAAAESFRPAVAELRAAFGPALPVTRLGADLGVIAAADPTVEQVAAACRDRPLVCVRHLSVERARLTGPASHDLDAVAAAAVAEAAATKAAAGAEQPAGDEVSVQVWFSGEPRVGYGVRDLGSRVSQALTTAGYRVRRSGAAHVLSCCVSDEGVSIGVNRLADSLADWPGGRVRLARGPDQVSRAEFKLEELCQLVPAAVPTTGRAVDLGASPGGWTRILRRRGLTVHAVDPGDLDPRVAADPGVTHVRTTAGEFFRRTDLRFDLAANDMRMDPVRSCQVMRDLAPRLRPGAAVIVTLKTGARAPHRAVPDCLSVLRERYTVEFARQLHHNRGEVTVLARLPR
ncbi:hypothetical protein JQS43_15290 [Natronosporangium hydrolyticum]|uniref:Ribosomal RNA methyltransferase FtsJ domain-containing protein n=1 Tax=Natronosporangium hydrolyticum TaxID=2811111 RepID=A0A895YEQ6_9ACTN|nr:SAM-dependent methyltransferase [Natronosporangium hydrolyticum]QSB13016.1 hypothetical protein JQS43_15290 [Natronosporangium hydrolyticum]